MLGSGIIAAILGLVADRNEGVRQSAFDSIRKLAKYGTFSVPEYMHIFIEI